MNPRLLRPFPSLRVAVLFCAAFPSLASSQTTVGASIGIEIRYHGDTIWRIRDTTVSRTIIRADTVIRSSYTHGRLRSTITYVLRGDLAIAVDERDSTGARRPASDSTRSVPLTVALGDLQTLEQSIRSNAAMSRMSGMMRPDNNAPLAPRDVRRYAFSANVNIVQLGDTVWYIRGCSAAPPADTTKYVFVPGDSLRRLSPSPRTFDRHMVAAVRADMNTVEVRQRAASTSTESPDLPRPRKWPCDMR